MSWELKLINFLQKFSNTVLDTVFLGVTRLGEEIFFIAVILVLFWCYDKRFGLSMGVTYLFSALTVNLIKNLVMRPRPYTFSGIKSIGAKTHGYSFPSGHTQSITTIASFTSLEFGLKSKKRWWVVLMCALAVVAVGFSRIYLGQHYLTDVLCSFAICLAIAIIMWFAFLKLGDREEYFALALIPIAIALMSIFHTDPVAHKVIFLMGGALISVAIGYFLEKRYIKYDVRQELWWVQILKIISGAAVAFALKEGLKPVLSYIGCGVLLSTFIRYFLLGLWCSFGAMAFFKYTLLAIKKRFPFWKKELPNEKL